MSTEVIEYNITDAQIKEIADKFLPLKLTGPDDKEGYVKIVQYRKEVKSLRLDVETKRKELKADSLAYGKRIDAEAKRITEQLQPIEASLIAQENIVKDEKTRLEAEQKKIIEERKVARTKLTIDSGAVFDGNDYRYGDGFISNFHIQNSSDEEFNEMIANVVAWKKIQDEKLAEEKRKRDEENQLQAEIAEEQRLKQEELKKKEDELKAKEDGLAEKERVAKENERIAKAKEEAEAEAKKDAEEAEIKAKKDAEEAEAKHQAELEAKEKQRIADEERHAKEVEEAKVKAAQDEKDRLEQEEKDRVEKERLDKEEAEKTAKLLPEKEKLAEFALIIVALIDNIPELETEEGEFITRNIEAGLSNVILMINTSLGKL